MSVCVRLTSSKYSIVREPEEGRKEKRQFDRDSVNGVRTEKPREREFGMN